MSNVPTSPSIPASMRVSARLKALAEGGPAASEIVAATIPAPRREPSSAASSSPLRSLAQSIVDAADQAGQTPILVPGARVILEPQVFAALSSELVDIAGRAIRIEAFSPAAGGWAALHLLRSHRRIVSELAADVPYNVEVVEINRISRPAGSSRPLFIGLATSNRLLRWLPTASCYRYLMLESGLRTALPEGTQATVERFQLTAINGGNARR